MKRALRIVCPGVLLAFLITSFAQGNKSQMEEQRFSEEMREILSNPDSFTLYSVLPVWTDDKTKGELFRNHQVLGRVKIKNAGDQRKLVVVLDKALTQGREFFSMPKCFDPRHGIRATKGTNELDLLVCFECTGIHAYLNQGTNQDYIFYSITAEPKNAFNEALRAGGVAIQKTEATKD